MPDFPFKKNNIVPVRYRFFHFFKIHGLCCAILRWDKIFIRSPSYMLHIYIILHIFVSSDSSFYGVRFCWRLVAALRCCHTLTAHCPRTRCHVCTLPRHFAMQLACRSFIYCNTTTTDTPPPAHWLPLLSVAMLSLQQLQLPFLQRASQPADMLSYRNDNCINTHFLLPLLLPLSPATSSSCYLYFFY